MAEQLSLFEMEPEAVRLRGQVGRLYDVLAATPLRWWSLAELAHAVGRVSEAGISARLRDLRKPRYGAHVIERQRVKGGNGLHVYRLTE